MKLKGGMDMDAVKFNEDVRDVALSLIGHARLVVMLPADALRDVRFNYDQGVLWRLESMFSEDEFLREPLKCVEAALIDAAQSDHWYTHEKRYDYHEEVDDSDTDEEAVGC